MSGMFRSMVGGKAPQWPSIPWHVTDGAAALPPDHAKYAAGEHTKCAYDAPPCVQSVCGCPIRVNACPSLPPLAGLSAPAGMHATTLQQVLLGSQAGSCQPVSWSSATSLRWPSAWSQWQL